MNNKKRSAGPDISYINGEPVLPWEAPSQRKHRPEMNKLSGRTFAGTNQSTAEASESLDDSKFSVNTIKRRKRNNARRVFDKYKYSIIAAIVLLIVVTVAFLPTLISGKDGKRIKKRDVLPESTYVSKTVDKSIYLVITEDEATNAKRIPDEDENNEDGTKAISVKRNSEGIILFATYYTYDDEGELLYESKYISNGILALKTVYYAEDEGCVKSVLTPKSNSTGDFDGYTIDEYKQNGSIYKSTEYTSWGTSAAYTQVSAYDKSGRVKLENIFPAYGTQPTSFKEYTYNDAGKVAEVNEYDFDNVLIEKSVYEYDELGRVSKISYYQMGVCSSYEEYSYYPEEGYYSVVPYTLTDQISKSYKKDPSVQYIYDP